MSDLADGLRELVVKAEHLRVGINALPNVASRLEAEVDQQQARIAELKQERDTYAGQAADFQDKATDLDYAVADLEAEALLLKAEVGRLEAEAEWLATVRKNGDPTLVQLYACIEDLAEERRLEINRLTDGIYQEIMSLDGSASGIEPVVLLAQMTADNLRRLLTPTPTQPPTVEGFEAADGA